MTPAERKALLFLSGLAALGLGVRVVRTEPSGPAATVETRRALLRQIAAVDSARRAKASREGEGRAGKGKRKEAKAEGAARRGTRGAAAAPAASDAAVVPPSGGGVSLYGAVPSEPPGMSPSDVRSADPRRHPVDVDRASESALEALPGIGPALARRIVEERRRGGDFGTLDALDRRVKGVGPAMLRRLAPVVTFSGVPRPPTADAGAASPSGSGEPARRRPPRRSRP